MPNPNKDSKIIIKVEPAMQHTPTDCFLDGFGLSKGAALYHKLPGQTKLESGLILALKPGLRVYFLPRGEDGFCGDFVLKRASSLPVACCLFSGVASCSCLTFRKDSCMALARASFRSCSLRVRLGSISIILAMADSSGRGLAQCSCLRSKSLNLGFEFFYAGLGKRINRLPGGGI